MDAISCLEPPAALLATSFADAAIARALHLSMSSSSLSAPAPLLAAAHPPPAYAPHLTTCDSVLVTESPPGGRRSHQQQQLAPAGRRAGKRRSRASKRAPTTYISTDPANFRIMVQHITGVEAEPGDMLQQTAADMLVLAADAGAAGLAYGGDQLLPSAAAGGDEAAALHQQPCFPTLDSWNVAMYERSELL